MLQILYVSMLSSSPLCASLSPSLFPSLSLGVCVCGVCACLSLSRSLASVYVCVQAVDREGRIGIGSSARFEVSPFIVKQLFSGRELADVIGTRLASACFFGPDS